MTDPFTFSRRSLLREHDEDELLAPADAVESWIELAELACAEFGRMGVPASISVEGDSRSVPPGVDVHVSRGAPYGVEVRWKTAVFDSPGYRAKLIAQANDDPFLVYERHVQSLMSRAAHKLLEKAGFRVLVDNSAHMDHEFRVLAAPTGEAGSAL
ncbi:hypothetical protein [Amycolatopsis circi]|uniref:hypothetical protein n=1 Tax=Amycolatopsis circi TaxID=871959 RepID=UPI000E2324A6|nr:hypothetical protein [Amycolatopsis circi]